ncbi:hypothetical protein ACJJTC_013090 [Scirpophaga incertulas]
MKSYFVKILLIFLYYSSFLSQAHNKSNEVITNIFRTECYNSNSAQIKKNTLDNMDLYVQLQRNHATLCGIKIKNIMPQINSFYQFFYEVGNRLNDNNILLGNVKRKGKHIIKVGECPEGFVRVSSWYSLYKITVQNLEETKLVNQLENVLQVDVWAHPLPNRPGQVLVPENTKQYFENELFAAGIQFEIVVKNIKDVLEIEENLLSAAKKFQTKSKASPSFDTILEYQEVEIYLREVAANHPNLVTLASAGKSIEDRDLWYLKISTTNFQNTSKPVVYMQSLLHAREWITLPVTLYAINSLVTDVSVQEELQDIDWIIMPVANPDGYVHTHEESRFWRKNRAKNDGLCDGVDLNRNFDINWGQDSSSITCMDNYHGKHAFSEPETLAIRRVLLEHLDRLELFLDIHSFGSMILYGYGDGTLPPNGLVLNLVAVKMAETIDAIKMSYNPNYIVGNVALILYAASGSAMDFAKSVRVPLSYTYELPGYRFASNTALGFLVDPSFIEQAGLETWEGIKVGARHVRDQFSKRNNV